MKYREMDRDKLERIYFSQVNWFFWIGILSLVNSCLYILNQDLIFVIGLEYTQFFDGFVKTGLADGLTGLLLLGILLDVGISASFLLIGYFSKQMRKTVLLIGTILYGIDLILALIVNQYINVAFHAFALFFLVNANRIFPELKSRFSDISVVTENLQVKSEDEEILSSSGISINLSKSEKKITKRNSLLPDKASLRFEFPHKGKTIGQSIYNEIDVQVASDRKIIIDRTRYFLFRIEPSEIGFRIVIILKKGDNDLGEICGNFTLKNEVQQSFQPR